MADWQNKSIHCEKEGRTGLLEEALEIWILKGQYILYEPLLLSVGGTCEYVRISCLGLGYIRWEKGDILHA